MATGSPYAFLARVHDVSKTLIDAARAPGFDDREQAILVNASRGLWDARSVLLGHFDDPSVRRRRAGEPAPAPVMPAGSIPLAVAAERLGLTELATGRRVELLKLGHFIGNTFCVSTRDLPRIAAVAPPRGVRRPPVQVDAEEPQRKRA